MAPTNRKKSSNNATTKVGSNAAKVLDGQLDRAYTAVVKNQFTVQELHKQWRLHLLRLSYLVIVLTFHQCQVPITNCIKQIKAYNKLQIRSMLEPMNGYGAMTTIFHDSFTEVLGIVCAGCLSWCLMLPAPSPGAADFTTLPFRIAAACIPMIGSLYYNYKTKLNEKQQQDDGMLLINGCLTDEALALLQEEEEQAATTTGSTNYEHSFPIIFIFFSIVTLSLAFMQYQNKQTQINIDKRLKLKKDLHTEQTENKNMKKKK